MSKKIKKKTNLSNKSQLGMIVFRFSKNKLAMFGLAVIVILALLCVAAPLYIDYESVYQQSMADRFILPCAEHPLGTDQFGRDLFARIIYGGRISLLAGLVVVAMALVLGIVLGGIAGYYGGRIDNVIMRICDVFMAVPRMLLSMAVVAALGQGTFKMLIALSIAAFPGYARTVRATLGLGGTILAIASLGFLGIGVASPTPEWGTILSENRANIRYYPYLGLVPGMFIAISVMCLNFIGDGLRDALDPRMKN